MGLEESSQAAEPLQRKISHFRSKTHTSLPACFRLPRNDRGKLPEGDVGFALPSCLSPGDAGDPRHVQQGAQLTPSHGPALLWLQTLGPRKLFLSTHYLPCLHCSSALVLLPRQELRVQVSRAPHLHPPQPQPLGRDPEGALGT